MYFRPLGPDLGCCCSDATSSTRVPDSPLSVVTKINLKLPQEIWEAVIDHLWRHRYTLQSCSLTCRFWTHRAQAHLHRSCSILCPRLATNPDLYSSPKVAQLVRHLRVILLPAPPREATGFSSVEDIKGRGDPYERRHRNAIYIWRILSRLTRLQTLELSGFRWSIESLEALELASSVFRGITVLEINGLFENAHAFLAFLSLFPRLSSLKITGIDWVSRKMSGSSSPSSQPLSPESVPCHRLRVLSFMGDGCNAKVMKDLASEWLSSLASNGVNGLRVQWYPCENSKGLPEVLGALGPSVDQPELSADQQVPKSDLQSLGKSVLQPCLLGS